MSFTFLSENSTFGQSVALAKANFWQEPLVQSCEAVYGYTVIDADPWRIEFVALIASFWPLVIGMVSLLRTRGHTDQLLRMAYAGILLFGVSGIMRAVRPAFGLEMVNLIALLIAATGVLAAAAAEWRWAGPSFGRWMGYLFCCGCGKERAARIRRSLLSRRLSKGCGECGGFMALGAFLVIATIYAQTGPDISSVVQGSNNVLLATVAVVFVLGVVPVLVCGAVGMSIVGYRVPAHRPMLRNFELTRSTRTEWTCLVFTALAYILAVFAVGAVDLQCINGRVRWPPFMLLRGVLIVTVTQLAAHYCAFLQYARAQENKLATFVTFWPQCATTGRNFMCCCGPRCVPLLYTTPLAQAKTAKQRAAIHTTLSHIHEHPAYCCACGMAPSQVGTVAACNACCFGDIPLNERTAKLEAPSKKVMSRFERNFARWTTSLGDSQEDTPTLLVDVSNELLANRDDRDVPPLDLSHKAPARHHSGRRSKGNSQRSPRGHSRRSPRSPRSKEAGGEAGALDLSQAKLAPPAGDDGGGGSGVEIGNVGKDNFEEASLNKRPPLPSGESVPKVRRKKTSTSDKQQSRKSMALMTLPNEYELWGDLEVAMIDTESSEEYDGMHFVPDEESEALGDNNA